MNLASGNDVTAFTTWSDALLVASSDASGEAAMNRLMWLWSSMGANKLVHHGFEAVRRRYERLLDGALQDRKSTRLNSSHGYISYAVFCLKKKKKNNRDIQN